MLEGYYKEKENRREEGLPPLPLNAEQVQSIADLFEKGQGSQELLDLLEHQVPPGVDEAAYVKAAFLKDLALEKISTELISPEKSLTIFLVSVLVCFVFSTNCPITAFCFMY